MRVSSPTRTTPSRSPSCARTSAQRASPWGEPDALATHAQLLAEKRVGFLFLTVGLLLYLSGLVLKSPEELVMVGTIAAGVVVAGVVTSLAFTHVVGSRIREQAREAMKQQDPDALPEQ